MGHCPRLTPFLRYWCTLCGVFPFYDLPPGGTLLPGEEGPGSYPNIPTDDMVSPGQLPVEGLVRECDDVTAESITGHGGWPDPEVVGTPAVVAMVGMDALPMRNSMDS